MNGSGKRLRSFEKWATIVDGGALIPVQGAAVQGRLATDVLKVDGGGMLDRGVPDTVCVHRLRGSGSINAEKQAGKGNRSGWHGFAIG